MSLEGLAPDDDGFVLPKRRRKAEEASIDFSPMADMVFQLLAFFIMTVQLANQESVDVPTISYGKGLNIDTATIISIKAPGQTNPEHVIMLGDGTGPEATLDQVRSSVEQGVAQGRPDVIIKAERMVLAGIVLEVSKIVKETEGASLYIGVKDQE